MDIIANVLVLTAVGVIAWGFYRARPQGRLGILAWLQSASLLFPWLLTFGLAAAGIAINLASVLFVVVLCSLLYIFLGRQLRLAKPSQPITSKEVPWVDAAQENPQGEPELDTPELPIPAADLHMIQGMFGLDTFFVTETLPYQEGAIFKGNLRQEPELAYARIAQSLKDRLGDQYRLFLLENQDGKPVVVVLPSRNDPKPAPLTQKILAGVLLLATIFTSLETAALLQNFDLLEAPQRFREALPIGLGILSILGIHEVGHQLFARRHQVRLGPPLLIPAWQIGSFGALTRFESLVPNRKVLLDVALAGPAAAGLFSLGLLLIGFFLSNPNSLFQVPAPFFQGSILVGTLARVVLGPALQQPLVAVHPLVAIGWLGLVITALNLMPAGQLDGGRVVQAIYGRKTAGRATSVTLIVLAIATLFNPLALYWAVVILFLQRDLERPSLNELSEPDDQRAALGLLALFLMAATLLPLTPSLATRLGIGS